MGDQFLKLTLRHTQKMKLAVVAASLLASVNSQATKALNAKCLFENGIEKLVIDIPYPDADDANILKLAAVTCDETSYSANVLDSAGNEVNGGSITFGVDNDMV